MQLTAGIAGAAAVGGYAAADTELDDETNDEIDERVAGMSLAEKVGQMTQLDLARLSGEDAWDGGELNEELLETAFEENYVGSILSGGGSTPVENTPEAWAETTNEIQEYAIEATGVPVIYGIDAVHGHSNVVDATMFPHAAGVGATWDPEYAEEIGDHTAEVVRATGIHWNFGPAADLARDLRWGRYYESFSEDPVHTSIMTAAETRGLQGEDGPDGDSIAATIKHFTGYSEPFGGLDRNPAHIPQRRLRTQHLPPFQAGLDAGAATVMMNSGSLNGVPAHASEYLIQELLREEMGFDGVIVSDWEDIHRLRSIHEVGESIKDAVRLVIGAGVDMYMVPYEIDDFVPNLIELVEEGEIPEERIDASVRRILKLKHRLDLFDDPYVDPGAAEEAVVGADRDLAHESAAKSMTLLENDGTLPLSGEESLLVTGPAATDVAIQMGGWTVEWQGLDDAEEEPPAVTVLEGLEDAAGDVTHVPWDREEPGDEDELESAAEGADVAVVCVGEGPYAEGPGDDQSPSLADAQADLIEQVADTDTPVVCVMLSGRPLTLEGVHEHIDAFVMGYLPGTEAGTAVADVLLGEENPGGRLPFTWPRHVGQAPIYYNHYPGDGEFDPLYEFGDGESYTDFEYELAAVDPGTVSDPSPDSTVELTVEVDNTGEHDGDDVVLVFGDREFTSGPLMLPDRQLLAFERCHVESGGSVTLSLEVPLGPLALVSGDVPDDGERYVESGEYRLFVGEETTELHVE